MPTTRRNTQDVGRDARERLRAATTLSERYVTAAGVTTAVLEGGEGPPMVLLHGQGEFWAVWMPVIDELVRTHRLVVVDLPGHGASTVVEGKLSSTTVLRWLDELIRETCRERPVLVGHLLGGAIAARYAAQPGSRLSQLVLVDTMGLGWFRPSLDFAIPMAGFIARPTARSRDRLFRQCFLDFDGVGDRFGDRWDDLRSYALARARTPENQRSLRALMPRIGVPPIPRTDLDRIGVPVTLVHGRYDLQVPLRLAEETSRRQGWPLHVIEGARDDPAAEQPAAFVAAVRAALAGQQHRPVEGPA